VPCQAEKRILSDIHVRQLSPSVLFGDILRSNSHDTVGNNLYFCSNRVTKEYAIGARTKDNKSYFIAVPSGVQKVTTAPYAQETCKAAGLAAGAGDTNAWATAMYFNNSWKITQ